MISRKVFFNGLFLIPLISLSGKVSANSVLKDVTHSITAPKFGYIGSSTKITWSTINGYSKSDFSHVRIGYSINGSFYNFRDYIGNETDLILNQVGEWCFIIRGWSTEERGYSLFNFEDKKCIQVK